MGNSVTMSSKSIKLMVTGIVGFFIKWVTQKWVTLKIIGRVK